MRITLRLPYWDDGVGCFDPQRFVVQLLACFPGAEVDPTDRSSVEVEQVERFLASSDATEDVKESMRRQIRGKAQRMGPAYHFRLSLPSGCRAEGLATRYSITFRSEQPLSAEERELLTEFLTSLRLGAPQFETSAD